ncbi:hypothetical protein [Pararhizobium sp. DWP1-1-3]|uniref:hypothetical protein n=1 Tax=Pararhizobium sp. DWP1-1-3 TaxID=2804652 RepID=UPI003CF1681F
MPSALVCSKFEILQLVNDLLAVADVCPAFWRRSVGVSLWEANCQLANREAFGAKRYDLTPAFRLVHTLLVHFLPAVLNPIDAPVMIGAIMHAVEFIGHDNGSWPEFAGAVASVCKPGNVVLAKELFHHATLNVLGEMIDH